MDKSDWQEFCALVEAADEATARKARSKGALALMFNGLMGYAMEEIRRAVSEHILSSPYAVKPADIVRHLSGSPEERAAIAWRVFVQALDMYGYYDSVRFPDPAFHYVVQQYGGWQALSLEWHSLTSKELEFRAPEWRRLFEVGRRVASWSEGLGRVKVPAYLIGRYESHNREMGGKFIPDVIEIASGRRIPREALEMGNAEGPVELPDANGWADENSA